MVKSKGIKEKGRKSELYKKAKLDIFAIANALCDGIYVIDNTGKVIDANKTFMDIVGLKGVDLIGKHMQMIWDEKIYRDEEAFVILDHEDKLPSMALINGIHSKKFKAKVPEPVGLMVLKEKKEISVITRIARRKKTVIMTGIPFFDEYGEVEFVVTAIRDVSEFIKLKERLEVLESDKELYINELKYLRESQMQVDLIGNTVGINMIIGTIRQVASTDVTVLITGETGVGKEVVAREIYKNSGRKNGPYIKVNCAAIPENLLESELFGYEKGAFTGAGPKNKLGLFHMANNGTILLDEIGEMPIKLQSKLLRALQEKEITRVGGTSSIKVDVRVIAATNQNLQEQVKKGLFREDLYYRLNVFPIKILPLRERKEDILTLSRHFVDKFNKKYNKNKKVEKGAVEALEHYRWPGNIRELENIIERLMVISDKSLITREDVVSALGNEAFSEDFVYNDNTTLKEAVNLLEKNMIEKALKRCGSTYKAANVLGITQSAVVKKAKALGIKKSDEKNHCE